LDLNKGEKEESEYKKNDKKFWRGGSLADHRAGGGSDRHFSSSLTCLVLERVAELFSLT